MSGHAAAAPRDELAAFQLIEFFKPRQPGPDCRIPNWRGSVADDLANEIIAKRIIGTASRTAVRRRIEDYCSETNHGSSNRPGSAALQMGRLAQFGAIFGRRSRGPRARHGQPAFFAYGECEPLSAGRRVRIYASWGPHADCERRSGGGIMRRCWRSVRRFSAAVATPEPLASAVPVLLAADQP